jgi:ParB family chromosome partitioning protein
MFSAAPTEALSDDNNTAMPTRVASGSIRSVKDSLTGIERENDALREAMASGAMVVLLDPVLIDPSPLTDRFVETERAAFESLKASIEKNGQEVPILVRQHPAASGRYQAAYGHRRLLALRELGRPVKAIVKTLTDQDLIIAQGIENSARKDLTFIERAVFAMRVEDAGYDRSVVQEALSIDRAEASKLVSVARIIPKDLIDAVGKAPKIGRGRWQAFADATKDPVATNRMRGAVLSPGFQEKDSDNRFVFLFSSIRESSDSGAGVMKSVSSVGGRQIARITQLENELKISVDRKINAGFAVYLIDQLPRLFETYQRINEKILCE